MHTVTENKTGVQMAAEYADGIVGDLEALTSLVTAWDELNDYLHALQNGEDTATIQELRDDAEFACGGDAALEAALRLMRELTPDDAGEAIAAWVDGVLDVEVGGRYNGGWEVTEVAFLVAFGGPSCRVVWDGFTTLKVRCSWWSQEVTRLVECEALADYAQSIAESVEA